MLKNPYKGVKNPFKNFRIVVRMKPEDAFRHIGVIVGSILFLTPMVVGVFTGSWLAITCLVVGGASYIAGTLLRKYDVRL